MALNAVSLDGIQFTSDWLTRGSDLTGNADGKKGIFSGWVNLNANGNLYYIVLSANVRVQISKDAANKFNIQCNTSAPTVALAITSTGTHLAADGWIHILASWDLSTTTAHLYIDDVDEKNAGATVNNLTIDYTDTDWAIGSDAVGVFPLNGCLSEIYLNTAEYLDLSQAANRRKFVTASLEAVDLGVDGSTPTGTAPIIYLDGDSTNFQTNQGTGGNFTVTGTLTNCASAPPEFTPTLDSEAKRMCALGMDLIPLRVLPKPDSTIAQADRQSLAAKYCGILATAGGTITTEAKRMCSLGIDLLFLKVYPKPDGSISQADRQSIAAKYCGILASGAVVSVIKKVRRFIQNMNRAGLR